MHTSHQYNEKKSTGNKIEKDILKWYNPPQKYVHSEINMDVYKVANEC